MKLTDIKELLPKISEQGFNVIQTPVLQPNKFIDLSADDIPWWGQFQVTSLSKIGNQYGSLEDLRSLVIEAAEYNIDISVNVVFTHVAGMDNGNIYPHQLVDDELKNNFWFWKSFSRIQDWNNRFEVTTKSHGLPCLRLDNYELQDIIIGFLNKLVDSGVRGIRIDSGKSISLPFEGNHFFTRVIGQFKDRLYDYTEVIFENKWLIDEYSKYTNVLTSSFGSDKSKLVTFVNSHDTDLEFHITDRTNSFTLAAEYLTLCETFDNTLWYLRKKSDGTYDEFWKTHIIKIANERRLCYV